MSILMIVLCGVNLAIYIFRAGSAAESGENFSPYIGAICGWHMPHYMSVKGEVDGD